METRVTNLTNKPIKVSVNGQRYFLSPQKEEKYVTRKDYRERLSNSIPSNIIEIKDTKPSAPDVSEIKIENVKYEGTAPPISTSQPCSSRSRSSSPIRRNKSESSLGDLPEVDRQSVRSQRDEQNTEFYEEIKVVKLTWYDILGSILIAILLIAFIVVIVLAFLRIIDFIIFMICFIVFVVLMILFFLFLHNYVRTFIFVILILLLIPVFLLGFFIFFNAYYLGIALVGVIAILAIIWVVMYLWKRQK